MTMIAKQLSLLPLLHCTATVQNYLLLAVFLLLLRRRMPKFKVNPLAKKSIFPPALLRYTLLNAL